MPQPLPHFNNGIDPCLPGNADIKPALYRYDEYQTYDYLYAARFSASLFLNIHFVLTPIGLSFFTRGNDIGIINFKPETFSRYQEVSYYFGEYHKNISPITVEALFERFTPWDYPYASEYIEKMYDFYRFFSGSDLNDCAIYTGLYNPITYQGRIHFFGETEKIIYDDDGVKPDFAPPSIGSLDYSTFLVVDQIEVDLPVTNVEESVVLTYYRKEIEEYPSVYTKLYSRFSTGAVAKKVKINIPDLLLCSIVVSSSNQAVTDAIKSQINNLSKGYLYENLDELLAITKNYIAGLHPRMNKFVEKVSITFNWVFLPENPKNSGYGTAGIESYTYHPLVFTDKPDWYEFAGINYATNDYWQNGQSKTDIGQAIVFYDPVKTEGFQVMGDFTKVNQSFIPDTGIEYQPYQYLVPDIADEISFDANYGGHVGYRLDSEGGETFNGFGHVVQDRVAKIPQELYDGGDVVRLMPPGTMIALDQEGIRFKSLYGSPIVERQYGDISMHNYAYTTRHPSYENYGLAYSGAYTNVYSMFTVGEVNSSLKLNFTKHIRTKYGASSVNTDGATYREYSLDLNDQTPQHNSVTANFVRIFRSQPPPFNSEFAWTKEQMIHWLDVTKHYA